MGTASQMLLQQIRQIMAVDHDIGDTGIRQPIKRMVDQGLAPHLDQRLWPVPRQGAHTGAEPGGEQHHRVRCGH